MTNARPILFSGRMVRAILAGTKTQTRRAVKLPPELRGLPSSAITIDEFASGWIAHSCRTEAGAGATLATKVWTQAELKCPFRVGMRLWVREMLIKKDSAYGYGAAYAADGHFILAGPDAIIEPNRVLAAPWKWKNKTLPSIHMPQWASRLTLEVTQVRAERVRDISEEDARAEGFDAETCEEVLRAASRGIEPEDAYCIRYEDDTESDGWMCYSCAEKEAGKDDIICCGHTPESDGPAFCDECYKPLSISLTQYGIERELRIEDDPKGKEPKYFPCKGNDAAIAAMIAGGIGDLRDEHLGRLAQVGFATKWNELNGAESWEANPFVWVVSFRPVEKEDAK